jgi:hypothetical protein
VSARPFRLTAPEPDEDQLHAQVAVGLRKLCRPEVEWTTFPAGNVPLPPEYAAKLARLGLQRGWPDILIVYAGVFGIELKVKGRGLSKTRMVRTRSGALRVLEGQEDVFPRLEAAGMPIAVCRSLDDVIDALAGWNIPMIGARVAA